ncbi:MAG: CAP domain-containing protein [Chloroflexales bacterium]
MSRLHPALHLLVAVLTLVLQGTALAQPSAPTITKRVYLPLVACTGCTGSVSASPQPAPVVPAPVDAAAYATRFLQLVNERRAAAGCPAAVSNAALMQATGDAAADWSNQQGRVVDYYATYGYPNSVAETAIPSDSAPTPEQAITTLETEQWAAYDLLTGVGPPSNTLASCLPAGSVEASYDLGIGVAGKNLVVALSANFFEARAVALVNVARVAAGCPVALPHPALMQATRAWSTYMRTSGDYSHGDYWVFDKKYAAYPGVGVYENIAGAHSADTAVNAWFTSPLHKRNMLWCYPPSDPSYSPMTLYEIGVGYDSQYWTLAIGDRD